MVFQLWLVFGQTYNKLTMGFEYKIACSFYKRVIYKRYNVRRKFHVCLLCNNMLILPKSKTFEIIIGWK